MPDLSVTYMGLRLENPFIASSCGLTGTVDGVQKCAEAGAGAVVLKSLFEEQIAHEVSQTEDSIDVDFHPEALEYVSQMGRQHGPREYLSLIETAKSAVSIPIIASVNCVTPKWWSTYARQIALSGADGIELNISAMPRSFSERSDSIEKEFLRVVEKVRGKTDLPIAVKIGPYFTSLPRVAVELRKAGVSALVLFNRFYQFDIDIEARSIVAGYQFSTSNEIHQSLRWISILSGNVGCDLAASTGVHTGEDAVKQLLAGANAVGLCSTLYKNGIGRIGTIRSEVSGWMDAHGYDSIDRFRGTLSQSASDKPEQHERLQYIKALTGLS